MPELFEYKQAKELINYYKKLLNELKRFEVSNKNYCKELNHKTKHLLNAGFFSSVIENDINSKENKSNNENLNLFISSIYFYMMSSIYTKKSNELINMYGNLVEEHIKNISRGTNAFLWLLTSKNKKVITESSYEELLKMKEDTFVRNANELILNNESIRKTPIEEIINSYQNNLTEFKEWMLIANNNSFIIPSTPLIFNKFQKDYLSVTTELSNIKNSIEETTKEIKQNIDYLIAEEFVSILRGIPVDELARGKPGLKIKYLKDGGFDNLANVFSASSYEISSVYGISQDAAYTIKRICDDYAKKIRKDIKIKLTVDNKTKSATKVVNSIYTYIKKMGHSEQINEIELHHGKNINSAIKSFNKLGNGILWLFLSKNQKNKIKGQYEYVNNTLSDTYKPFIDKVKLQFARINSSSNEAWADFSINSIKYYNIIEELFPGVLGTDDSIYGLPEELARKVQDECFFPEGLLCTLRKYQEWGVKYILHQEKVLLGDEMGLGKTIQAIASMVSLKNTGATHFLVVCPASVVTNWCREIVKHSKLRVTKIHGQGKTAAFKSWLKYGGVAVTNYESTSYIKLEENFKMSMLIVDEAHYIKNPEARRSINTRNLAAFTNRILFMTGTALENDVDEMISLIEVLQPSIAESIKSIAFLSSAPQFRERIAPVYYRRKREDVLTELPDKIETKEWCVLNAIEEDAYENAILEHRYQEARRVSWNIDDLSKSSKANRLKEIVEEAEKEGRKIIVFSFFLDTISKIYEFLKGRCLNPINGSVNVNRRQEIIDEFDKAPAGTVLLAQINSGGTGLNIQSASVVVICEPQFKPSIENQAISRAYRMGQSRNVLVYRLLCEDTIDEKLIDVLEEKQTIFDAFADKSVAAEKSLEVDEKSFGDIIKEEIDRIAKKRGQNTNTNSSNNDCVGSNDFLVSNIEYYKKIMKMSYEELVNHLIYKYGPAKYDYYVNESCSTKNSKVSRTSEGLCCHHIDEDKAIMLSNGKFASKNPFEYQKADRLVYCNILEHLLLHILIAEEPRHKKSNSNEIQGIGGAINFICKQLNDLYNGYIFTREWETKIMSVVKNDYESYILMLKRLYKLITTNSKYSSFTKDDLAKGYQGNVYTNILDELL